MLKLAACLMLLISVGSGCGTEVSREHGGPAPCPEDHADAADQIAVFVGASQGDGKDETVFDILIANKGRRAVRLVENWDEYKVFVTETFGTYGMGPTEKGGPGAAQSDVPAWLVYGVSRLEPGRFAVLRCRYTRMVKTHDLISLRLDVCLDVIAPDGSGIRKVAGYCFGSNELREE